MKRIILTVVFAVALAASYFIGSSFAGPITIPVSTVKVSVGDSWMWPKNENEVYNWTDPDGIENSYTCEAGMTCQFEIAIRLTAK